MGKGIVWNNAYGARSLPVAYLDPTYGFKATFADIDNEQEKLTVWCSDGAGVRAACFTMFNETAVDMAALNPAAIADKIEAVMRYASNAGVIMSYNAAKDDSFVRIYDVKRTRAAERATARATSNRMRVNNL